MIDVATRLQDALRRPFALRGVAVELEASIGVALYPEHGTTIGRLLQRADVAMYDAKRGRRGVATYTAERDPYSADRLGLLAELRTAIERDELVLHYQPKVSLASGELIGVEALVRWQHPTRGLLGPDAFVPLAERTGAVADLTRWVVDHALAACAARRSTCPWRSTWPPPTSSTSRCPPRSALRWSATTCPPTGSCARSPSTR